MSPRRKPQQHAGSARGQQDAHGRGCEYVPAVHVRDFGSRGRAHRVSGRKTGRVHQFFSDHEMNLFRILEWSDTVIDIREQYALSVSETTLIARSLGIRHPTVVGSTAMWTMTTDFVVTVVGAFGPRDIALCVKEAKELESRNVLAKLEIERRYWERRGKVPWAIITERDIPPTFVKNLAWLEGAYQQPALGLSSAQVERIVAALLTYAHRAQGTPLGPLCLDYDDRLGLDPGSSLCLARHAIATKLWVVDLYAAIGPSHPLRIIDLARAAPSN